MAAQLVDIRLIVGLGNPGANYHSTRHNAGFWLVDDIAQAIMATMTTGFFQTIIAGLQIQLVMHDQDLFGFQLVVFSQRRHRLTAAIHEGGRLEQEDILASATDLADLAMKAGFVFQANRMLARDIVNHLGKDFLRLRIGIGHPGDSRQVVNFVLKNPSKQDLDKILDANTRTLNILPTLLDGQLEKTMQQLHTK